jgi:hypothetical protein
MPDAVFFDGFKLARDGAVLTFSATVAEVGVYDGASRNGGGKRGEGVGGQG